MRAKSKIQQAGIPFRLPERADLRERLGAVLAAIYTAFSEGWSDPAGTEFRRRNLAEEGIWLGRLVVSLLPEEPEALGLLALMLHAEARRGARRNALGEYVPLAEQDPQLWSTPLIEEAEALLFRASRMGAIGRYQLEAAVQSAHVPRRPPTGPRSSGSTMRSRPSSVAGGGDQPGDRGGEDARPGRRRGADAGR